MSRSDVKRAYAVLGLTPTQDMGQIRRAWRALVRKEHPDLVRNDRVAATARVAEINRAFDLLMSEAKRVRTVRNRGIARRMDLARRAEAKRQAEAREAEAERRAHAAHLARQRRAAARAQTKTTPPGFALVTCHSAGRDPALARAAAAFKVALASFSSAPETPKHNTTC